MRDIALFLIVVTMAFILEEMIKVRECLCNQPNPPVVEQTK